MNLLCKSIAVLTVTMAPLLANVQLTVTPAAVSVGQYGAREGYYIVHGSDGKEFNIGYYTDELAKSRFALVLSAISLGKNIEIGCWSCTVESEIYNHPEWINYVKMK